MTPAVSACRDLATDGQPARTDGDLLSLEMHDGAAQDNRLHRGARALSPHHRDHTEAFWNEVDKVMPDYQERKAWLRDNGASLDV